MVGGEGVEIDSLQPTALAQQQLDDLVVASTRCRLERVAEASTLRVDVGALAQQQLDDLVVASPRCRLERVAEVSTLRVDVGFGLKN